MGVYKNNNGTLQPIAGRGGALIDDTSTTTSNTWSASKMNNTFVTDANYTHTDNNYTSTEKSKLDSVATGAEVNVQADWEVTDNTSDAYVKNKPTVPEDIEDLSNVNISSATDGQVLKYDGTNEVWVNSESSDSGSIIKITFDSDYAGETYTVTNGIETHTDTVPSSSPYVVKQKVFALDTTFTVSSEVAGQTHSIDVEIGQYYGLYECELKYIGIYGVEWDGSSSPAWSRTDDSALFTDPSPAVANGNGSSPFDSCMPWSGMTRENRAGGVMVKIPKYYYKWTRSGNTMKLQIADGPLSGYHVSPAHADRGDGKGERDYVYVGAYHCASDYKSKTGVAPLGNKTRAEFRSGIHNLGTNIWQYDYAMYWTIMMLYLVEFANWNSQAKIGYGCGNNSSVENNGLTDGMTYHTGTNAANRTTYGHIRYRWIEGLWDNVYDWCDGIYFSGANVYCIKNPASFSDTSGGTNIGTRPTTSNYISKWTNPTASGFEYALYPSEVNGSESTYVCDYCSYDASGVVLHVGGNYGQYQSRGAFCLFGNNAASNKLASVGSRIQELP